MKLILFIKIHFVKPFVKPIDHQICTKFPFINPKFTKGNFMQIQWSIGFATSFLRKNGLYQEATHRKNVVVKDSFFFLIYHKIKCSNFQVAIFARYHMRSISTYHRRCCSPFRFENSTTFVISIYQPFRQGFNQRTTESIFAIQ